MSTSGFIYKITMEANQRFIRKIQTLAGLYFFIGLYIFRGLQSAGKWLLDRLCRKGDRGMIGVFMVVIVLLGGILYLFLSPKVPSISPDDLKKVMENNHNILIIDVREKREYESGHIPGAVHVPLRQLERLKKEADQQENGGECISTAAAVPAVRLPCVNYGSSGAGMCTCSGAGS